MASNLKVVPLKPAHERANEEAFAQVEPAQAARARRAPVITRDVGDALIAKLAANFRSGELQPRLSPLFGRVTSAGAQQEIPAWTPGNQSIEGRFLLGFSLSYEHTGSQGPAYNLRVRVFSDALIVFSKTNPQLNHFTVAIGNVLAEYANDPGLANLFPQPAGAAGDYQGIDFAGRYQVSVHPPVRRRPHRTGDKNRDHVIRLGDSIRHADDAESIGTLSLFVQWNNEVCGLGAAHVVTRSGVATHGSDILWARGGNDPNRPIGTYVHPAPAPFLNGQPAPLDAAIFKVDAGVTAEGNVFRRPGQGRKVVRVTGHCAIAPSQQNRRPKVKIVARGQRLVDAEIVGLNASFEAVGPTGDLYGYDGMLELRLPPAATDLPRERSILSLGGDSGAGLHVVAEDGSTAEFAGMVVCGNGKAGDGGLAYALGADTIFASLQITL